MSDIPASLPARHAFTGRPLGPVLTPAPDIAMPGAQQPAIETRAMPAAWQLDEGRKDDGGKPPVHLLPFDALEGITAVLRFGAGKYGPRNWERGMSWGRPFAACLRHLWAWWRGEKADPETGLSHLWHAGCCVLFLIAYEQRGVGTDDRPCSEPPVAPPPSAPAG